MLTPDNRTTILEGKVSQDEIGVQAVLPSPGNPGKDRLTVA